MSSPRPPLRERLLDRLRSEVGVDLGAAVLYRIERDGAAIAARRLGGNEGFVWRLVRQDSAPLYLQGRASALVGREALGRLLRAAPGSLRLDRLGPIRGVEVYALECAATISPSGQSLFLK